MTSEGWMALVFAPSDSVFVASARAALICPPIILLFWITPHHWELRVELVIFPLSSSTLAKALVGFV